MSTRFIFEVLKEQKVICQFTDSMSKSDKLSSVISNEDHRTKIKEKEVSEEFYQELVDEGGFIQYN